MSNLEKIRSKAIKLFLGGKERTLRYDLNAFAELEEKYGSIEKTMTALEAGSIKSVRLILWAGLLHEHQIIDLKTLKPTGEYSITPMDVGGWVSIADLPDISNAIREAMDSALPGQEIQEEANVPGEAPNE